MKKKIFASFMAMAMAATMLTGCGGGDKPAAGGSGSSAAASGGSGAYNMTLIMALRDEFLSAMETGAKNAASQVGVNLTTQDAQNDTGKLL